MFRLYSEHCSDFKGAILTLLNDVKNLVAVEGGRADSRRNLATLLESAVAVFAEQGVDAPVRTIAERAGVGVGTFYRHFPKRTDLIVAVFRHEVDACAATATDLQATFPPTTALEKWIARYAELIATKRGLSAALQNDDATYEGLPAYFEARLSPVLAELLAAAAATGEIRADVAAYDLLWAVATLCRPPRAGESGLTQRMIALLLDGLRVQHPA